MKLTNKDEDQANKIWESICNVAVKMSEDKNKTNKSYEVLKRGDETIIKFNDEFQQQITIPTSEYEKIKKDLETNKYEPENLSQNMREWNIQFEVRKYQDKDIVGACHRCSLLVKVGEGVVMLNSGNNIILHRKCFEIDKDTYEWVLLKEDSK